MQVLVIILAGLPLLILKICARKHKSYTEGFWSSPVFRVFFFSSLRFFVFEFLDVFSKFLTPDFFLISDVRFFSQFLMSDFFLISDVRFEEILNSSNCTLTPDEQI